MKKWKCYDPQRPSLNENTFFDIHIAKISQAVFADGRDSKTVIQNKKNLKMEKITLVQYMLPLSWRVTDDRLLVKFTPNV
jgi:hypothetical protein